MMALRFSENVASPAAPPVRELPASQPRILTGASEFPTVPLRSPAEWPGAMADAEVPNRATLSTEGVASVAADRPMQVPGSAQPAQGVMATFPRLHPGRPEVQPLDPAGSLVPFESRFSAMTTALAPAGPPTAPMAQQAAAIMQQLVQVSGQLGRGPIELLLSPEELGRVRLILTPGENGMVLSVMADRDETLALLRRNMDMLSNDLRDLGFANLSFQFGSGDGRNDRDGAPSSRPTGTEFMEPSGSPGPLQTPSRQPTDRLDLRL